MSERMLGGGVDCPLLDSLVPVTLLDLLLIWGCQGQITIGTHWLSSLLMRYIISMATVEGVWLNTRVIV